MTALGKPECLVALIKVGTGHVDTGFSGKDRPISRFIISVNCCHTNKRRWFQPGSQLTQVH